MEHESGLVGVHKTMQHINKTTQQRSELIDQAVLEEDVQIERVPKNQRVNGPLPMREEGETTIIPVVKQVVRVEWVLTEEVRVTRRQRQTRVQQRETVLEERVEVE